MTGPVCPPRLDQLNAETFDGHLMSGSQRPAPWGLAFSGLLGHEVGTYGPAARIAEAGTLRRPVRRREGALFFFRVVATTEGFECRRGREVLGRWPTLAEALDSCRGIAARHRPSVVYLHDAAGKISRVDSFDQQDPA